MPHETYLQVKIIVKTLAEVENEMNQLLRKGWKIVSGPYDASDPDGPIWVIVTMSHEVNRSAQ